MSEGPLRDITVVEVCSAIAGPFAGKLLADNGAEIIKVESPEGTSHRNRPLFYDEIAPDEFSYRFLAYNTGKSDIAVDLKSNEGTGILWDLIERADVLIENMRPGVLARLGFDWEEIHERNPELVYCSITGYGEDGPYEEWPAMDTTVAAVSGWLDQIGDPDRPETMNVFVIDHITALYAVNGILMALVERSTTGEGQRVDVTMLEAALSFLSHQFAEYSATEAAETLEARYTDYFAPNGVFEVADGFMALWVNPEDWSAFCRAIDREDLDAPDHPLSTADGRLEHRDRLREELEAVLADRTADEWAAYFDDHARGVICAEVNTIDDLPDDPQIQHLDALSTRTHPEVGEYTIPDSPLTFSRSQGTIGHAPGIGEHTTEILEALDYQPETIERLREQGVVR